jgi:inhibitor of KinA
MGCCIIGPLRNTWPRGGARRRALILKKIYGLRITMSLMHPLGDQAVLVAFAEEQAALRWAAAVRRQPAPWLVEVVAAYTTVAVYYRLDQISYAQACRQLPPLGALEETADAQVPRVHDIPCCYSLELDMNRVCRHTGLAPADVVAWHTAQQYTVYAIGFCPGFPYLGYLPTPLAGVPRLASPRLRVEAGSVGLTGRQTGIYTLDRPGGWNMIGRTPLQLVDVAAGYFPLHTGDRLRFVAIDRAEFDRLEGKRL